MLHSDAWSTPIAVVTLILYAIPVWSPFEYALRFNEAEPAPARTDVDSVSIKGTRTSSPFMIFERMTPSFVQSSCTPAI